MDKTHPMLANKVIDEANFSTATDTLDHEGHGTWVASAIAEREWASPDGLMIGMAPEAVLLNAKAFEGPDADRAMGGFKLF